MHGIYLNLDWFVAFWFNCDNDFSHVVLQSDSNRDRIDAIFYVCLYDRYNQNAHINWEHLAAMLMDKV